LSANILFYDIESTDLKGDFGNMVAFGYKLLGGETTVISLLDTNEICAKCRRVDAVTDKSLMKQAHAILSAADMWVTWYGKGFDAKFINTRIMDAHLPPLPDIPHVDLYFAAKHHLALSSNRLANVQNFLGLPTEKTPITKRAWRQAQAGHVPSIKYIIDHCAKDVDVLEQAYERLKPYVRTHPRVGDLGGCRTCGSPVHRRGYALSNTVGRRQRVQCTNGRCGAWETRRA